MIFPLVFTIRGSFRRREKALEHLSQFRASIKTIEYLFMSNSVISEEDKKELHSILLEISDKLMSHLRRDDYSTNEIDEAVNKVSIFFMAKGELVSRGLRDKTFRYMQDLHEAIENVHAIHIHRTPISLKAYCLIFIYIFPLIYAPTVISKIGLDTSIWVTYFIVILSEFILISLYNIQDQLEYPFDNNGLDDIILENFKIDR